MHHHHAAPQHTGEAPVFNFDGDFAEVKEFLKKEGFEMYTEHFHRARVGPAEVALLNDGHLKEMGITKVAHRIRILNVTKGFKRALKAFERDNAILDMQDWFWRPVLYPRTYKVTMASIIINEPHPLQCGYSKESIDISQIQDINMREWAGFLGIIELETTNPKFKMLKIRLALDQAEDVFNTLKNLWEEDQLRVGKKGAV